MKNHRKTAFLEKGYTVLSKNEQDYMKTLMYSLLHIQNTSPAAPQDPNREIKRTPEQGNKE